MRDDPLEVILTKLTELTAYPERICGPETEVYYDTRLEGEDGWELIDFIIDRFHTDFSAMNAGQYIPHEGGDLRTLLVRFGKRPYRSLTVRRLAEAVEIGEWQAE